MAGVGVSVLSRGQLPSASSNSSPTELQAQGCSNGDFMDSFGIFLQGLLGVVAFSTLMCKYGVAVFIQVRVKWRCTLNACGLVNFQNKYMIIYSTPRLPRCSCLFFFFLVEQNWSFWGKFENLFYGALWFEPPNCHFSGASKSFTGLQMRNKALSWYPGKWLAIHFHVYTLSTKACTELVPDETGWLSRTYILSILRICLIVSLGKTFFFLAGIILNPLKLHWTYNMEVHNRSSQ